MKQCKLCLDNVKKLSRSHIIPKFVYRKSGLIRENTGGMFDFQTGKIIKRPDGEYDYNLMCGRCENLVNSLYENYAKSLFYDGFNKKNPYYIQDITHPIEGNLIKYTGINYHKLKSYLLLNLWRAAVTERAFFNRIFLKDEDGELIRKKILENKSFEEHEFVISIHSYEYSKNIPPLISQPGSVNGMHFLLLQEAFISIIEAYRMRLKILKFITLNPLENLLFK